MYSGDTSISRLMNALNAAVMKKALRQVARAAFTSDFFSVIPSCFIS